MTNNFLRKLPSIDRLILSDAAKTLIEKYNRKQVVNAHGLFWRISVLKFSIKRKKTLLISIFHRIPLLKE